MRETRIRIGPAPSSALLLKEYELSKPKNAVAKDVWRCELPDKDPWHAEMLSYVDSQEVGPMDNCKPSFVEMTNFIFSPSNSTLTVKKEFTKAHLCRYRCIRPVDDYKYNAEEWKELSTPVQPDCDVFEVDCSLKEAPDKAVYNNLYYQI
uniref:Uncharacterized protein n=1 Tax=Ditylenchus dipsaci TaxID=166011 RepID=A0A915ER62_9BILA